VTVPLTTIVTTATLAAHLDDPSWVIVDCRFDLANPDAGEQLYQQGHIPGAVYAHLDHDLSGPRTGANGRHPLPSPGRLEQTLGRLGIEPGVQVVAYDHGNGMFASRLWWLLRASGHEAAAVLDGGFAAWTGERRPTRAGVEQRTAVRFEGNLAHDRWLSAEQVDELVGDADHLLIDSRSPERYQGLVEPIDAAAGHIPGAVNHYYGDNVTVDGRFRSPAELRALFTDVIGAHPPDRVIVYCGSGVSACHNLLALEQAGFPGARLYAGSWSEWSSNPARPVETGPGPEK
jgi:thiosulfate/3-mercaptopyruvate sulfurtransferase